MATFLHGSLMHIGFNMWVLMDIGPQIEELYGSARYFFIYVITGIGGYVLSGLLGHFSVGGSGALLGLIGVLLALTFNRRARHANAAKPVDQMADLHRHYGIRVRGHRQFCASWRCFVSGFAARKNHGRTGLLCDSRKRTRADLLGWATAIVVLASLRRWWPSSYPRELKDEVKLRARS